MFRRALLTLLTLGIGSLLAVAAAEIALRVLRPRAAGRVHQPLIYAPDTEIGARYRANAEGWIHRNFEIDNVVRTNALGFHDEEPDAREGALRILAVGDSFTAALHVPVGDTWTQVLERRLEARRGGPVRVFNLGIDGTGTDVHLELVRRHAPALAPELVLLAFFANDAREATLGTVHREVHRGYVLRYRDAEEGAELRRLAETAAARAGARVLFDHSYLFRAFTFAREGELNHLRTNVMRPSDVGRRVTPRFAPGRTGTLLRELAALARTEGFALRVVPVPGPGLPGESLRVLRRQVRSGEVEILDPDPELEQALARDGRAYEDLFWRSDPHLNRYGNRLLGEAVAEVVSGAGLVARADGLPEGSL